MLGRAGSALTTALTACALAALFNAGPTHADPPNTDGYLADMQRAGIPYRTPADAIDFGTDICDSLRSGQTLQQVVGRVAATGMSPDQGGPLIAISVSNLCPDQRASADAQAHAAVGAR